MPVAASFAFHIRKGGNECEIALVGEISEHARLDEVVRMLLRDGGPGKQITLDCGEVRRLNSFGCRSWTQFIHEIGKYTKRVAIRRMTPAMVQQANLVTDFLASAAVESYYAPYVCSRCDAEHLYLARGRHLPDELDCPACRLRTMKFDGDASVYRSFLLSAAQSDGGKLRVLLVDDEGFSRSMFRLGLRARFEIDVVESYQQAVEAIKQREYDVIVSDYRMPGQHGGDLLGVAMRWLPGSLRILLTAYPPDDLDELQTSGVIHAVMHKPASPAEVEARVREEIDRRGLRRGRGDAPVRT